MQHFTPWHCALGGLSLGIVSAAKPLLCGRILGISGAIKGALHGDFSAWRGLFLGGLAAGGLALAAFMPGALETLPGTFTVQRAAVGGLLVGAGAALGNGCTSGHGISGIARQSMRSIVYTLTFMLAGAAAVSLTGTMDALGIAATPPEYLPLSGADLTRGAAILGASLLGTAVLGGAARKSKAASLAYEATAGVVFALALGFTGMVRPSKVASFLAVGQASWNPSLAFVMGAALLVATPAMAFIKRRATALDGTALCFPASSVLDAPLLLGGALFGAGWGICGMCPGPLLVAAVQPTFSPQVLAAFGAMLAGLRIGDALKPACSVPLQASSKVASKQ